MIRSIYVLGLILSSVLVSCLNHSKSLSKADFGNDWPFKIESGKVECIDGVNIVFKTNGETYALNDAAKLSGEYKNVKEILRTDANYPGKKIMMDLSLVEFEGLKLCTR